MKSLFFKWTLIINSVFWAATLAQAQVQDKQELDPIKAQAQAITRMQSLHEPTPQEIEADLRAKGIVDPQSKDVELSDSNFPVGFFGMGPMDFIVVKIHRDSLPQYAEIFYNGEFVHSYWVSTGAEGHETPAVTRTVYERNWNRLSRAYGGTMTGAMMFMGGYGVHMTPFLSQLGRPASHGCVRMEDAGIFQIWKLALGTPNANITIQVLEGDEEGTPPQGKAPYQGGRLQQIMDMSGKPANGRLGLLKPST